jgi:hypothetical protein
LVPLYSLLFGLEPSHALPSKPKISSQTCALRQASGLWAKFNSGQTSATLLGKPQAYGPCQTQAKTQAKLPCHVKPRQAPSQAKLPSLAHEQASGLWAKPPIPRPWEGLRPMGQALIQAKFQILTNFSSLILSHSLASTKPHPNQSL